MRAFNVAVVGGGLGGLSCATKLLELLPQTKATVFDMGMRGPGGRASTRRQNGMQFDHGLQFMRLGDGSLTGDSTSVNDLRHQLSLWQHAGAATEWHGRFGTLDAARGDFLPRNNGKGPSSQPEAVGEGFCSFLQGGSVWVGTLSNDALCTSLAALHPGRMSHAWATKVTELRESAGGWEVHGLRKAEEGNTESTLGTFDAVILSDAMAGNSGSPGHIRMEAPALQDMSDRMAAATAAPRLSLMAAFPTGAFQPPFDATCVSGSDIIEWLCCDSAKPGRSTGGDDGSNEFWTAVSTEAFARRALEAQPLRVDGKYSPAQPKYMQDIAEKMGDAVAALLARWGTAKPTGRTHTTPAGATHVAAQRWGSCLYPPQYKATSNGKLPRQLMMSAADGTVAATGDWLAGSNADDVLRHAHETARRLAAALTTGM